MLDPHVELTKDSESGTGTISNNNSKNINQCRYGNINKMKTISRFLSPSFNIINTTLGSGVLNLGYGVKLMGVSFSSLLLIFTFLLTAWSFYVYARIGSLIYAIELQNKEKQNNTKNMDNIQDHGSFNITLRMIFSNLFPKVWYLMDTIIVINCFLGCVGYLITIGGSVDESFIERFVTVKSPWFKNVLKKTLILTPISIIQFLITFMESLDSLKPVSILGFFANFYIIGLNCYTILNRNNGLASNDIGIQAKNIFHKICMIMEYVGIFTVCFNCHYASIPLFPNFIQQYKKEYPQKSNIKSLKSSKNTFQKITVFSYICIFIVNFSIALTSYWAFKEDIKTDIQQNYGTSISAILLKLSISISVFCCFPIVLRSFSISFINLFPKMKEKKKLVDGVSISLIYLSAILITSLSDVNSFRGTLSGSIILYITPGLMILKLKGNLNTLIITSGVILSAYGAFCLVGGLISIVIVKIVYTIK